MTAYIQTPLYSGGTLSMWLGREENQVPLVDHTRGGKSVVIDRLLERAALCHLGALESILQALVLVHTLPAGA